MKNVFLTSLVIIIIMGASCRKSPVPAPGPSPTKKVTKISSGPQDYRTFEYDQQGLLTRFTSQWQNGNNSLNKITHTMEYNGDKLVKSTNDAGYILYSYLNELPAKAECFSLNGKKISTLLFHFSPQKKLEYVVEQIAMPGGPEETKVSYQYYANGNVSRIDFYFRLQISDPFIPSFSKEFVQYDNKKNTEPDEVLGNYLPGIILTINNPVKINNLDANGNIIGYSRYEYTYNAAGYPEQKKHFIATGTIEQAPILFQYSY